MRRALSVAVVVGPVLTLINQWEGVTGDASMNWWKVGLTFLVPYLVSTYSSARAAADLDA